jgi:hypothetical protein
MKKINYISLILLSFLFSHAFSAYRYFVPDKAAPIKIVEIKTNEGWEQDAYRLSPDCTKLAVVYGKGLTHRGYTTTKYKNYRLVIYDLADKSKIKRLWESQDSLYIEWSYDNRHLFVQTQLPNKGETPKKLYFESYYNKERLEFNKNNPLKIYSVDIQTNKITLISPPDKDTLYKGIFNDVKHPENVYFFTVKLLEIPENCRRNMAPPEIKHIFYGPKAPWPEDIGSDDLYGYNIKGIYRSNILTGKITDETNLWDLTTTHVWKAFVVDSCFYFLRNHYEVPKPSIYNGDFWIEKWKSSKHTPEIILKWFLSYSIWINEYYRTWLLSPNGQYLGVSLPKTLYLIDLKDNSLKRIENSEEQINIHVFSDTSEDLYYWTSIENKDFTYTNYLYRYNIISGQKQVILATNDY